VDLCGLLALALADPVPPCLPIPIPQPLHTPKPIRQMPHRRAPSHTLGKVIAFYFITLQKKKNSNKKKKIPKKIKFQQIEIEIFR
jgi:hypothetical protein